MFKEQHDFKKNKK